MADNVPVTPGTGADIATDDCGVAGHFQRIKLDFGGDGVSAPVTASTPLPVVQTGTPALPTGAATETTLAAISASVDGLEALATLLNGYVDGIEGLLAGTLTVGTHAVTQSGTWNIGSITTLPTLANVTTVATVTNITNQGHLADNAGFTDGTTRLMMAGYIFDEVAGTALTENDGAAARVDSKRAQVMVVEDATTRGQRQAVDASGNAAVAPKPVTSGGLTIGKLISAASTNATSLKGSAGQVYTIYAHNTNAAVRYLKLYNKASSPTVGTDTPVMTLPIPGNTAGNGFVLDTSGLGVAFAAGIAYALTTGVADADTGTVAANEIVLTILYK